MITVSDALRPFVSHACPETVLRAPAMMSRAEKRLLYGLARNYYTGRGVIVDAGTFLGGSTIALGHGVRDGVVGDKSNKKSVLAYDRCVVDQGMLAHLKKERFVGVFGERAWALGESFEQELRAQIFDVSELVELYVGDIRSVNNFSDDGVEIAFLDLLKTPEIDLHVWRALGPELLPGHSIVVQQDYFMERLPYINVHQEYLSTYFDYLGAVGPSAVFRLVASPTKSDLDIDIHEALTTNRKLELLRQAEERAENAERRAAVALSGVDLVEEEQGVEAAKEHFSSLLVKYKELLGPDKRAEWKELPNLPEKIVRLQKTLS